MEAVLTLEELIRDRAEKGEFVHLSLWHEISSGLWCATYAPAHEFGNNISRDEDPVKACEQAITMPKTKRRVTATVIKQIEKDAIPLTYDGDAFATGVDQSIDDWLPRA